MNVESKNNIYFPNLDSIRFIAALMVYLQHGIRPAFKLLPIQDSKWEGLITTICGGGTGVSIFFVLSGFLITYLLITENEMSGKVNLWNFYIRRVLRIWPLYFAVVLFAFCLYPVLKTILGVNQPLASNVFYHLTFLSNFDVINIQKNFFGCDAMSQNITWSVSIEEQFYLFWPLIFTFLSKRYWKYCIMAVIVFSMAFRIMHHTDEVVLYFHTFSVLVDLGMGGLFAMLIKENKRVKRFFENAGTIHHVLFLLASFTIVHWYKAIFAFTYGHAISHLFQAALFASVISAQAITKQKSFLNLQNITVFKKLGKYTYGIYLLHPIALTILSVLVRVLNLPDNNFISLFITGIIGYVFTLYLSKFSYRYFEKRFLTLKDKFSTIHTHT